MNLLTASFGDDMIHSTDDNGCNQNQTGLGEGNHLFIGNTSFAASPFPSAPFPCDSNSPSSGHPLSVLGFYFLFSSS
jgi:hypothetical protein